MRLTENGALRAGVTAEDAVRRLWEWERTGVTLREARALAGLRPGVREVMLAQYRDPVTGEPTAPCAAGRDKP